MAAQIYKGKEKELNVRQELWFPRYYAVNADILNNVARKHPTARIKMMGVQGDLKWGVRTKLEFTALLEDINAQVLEGTITKRPEWTQCTFESVKSELEWVDEGDGNRVLIVCSCPARIGDDFKIMEQVNEMCQGNAKVEITFSKAGNAASNMFESGAVVSGGGGGASAFPPELETWFGQLKISPHKTEEVLGFLCGDEVGVTDVEELLEISASVNETVLKIIPDVKRKKYMAAWKREKQSRKKKSSGFFSFFSTSSSSKKEQPPTPRAAEESPVRAAEEPPPRASAPRPAPQQRDDIAYLKKLLGTAIYDKLAATDKGIEVNEEGHVTALRVWDGYNWLLTESERKSLTFDIQALKSLRQLAEFYLNSTGVNGDIQALKSLPQLTLFYLYNTGVTGDIQALKSLPQLTEFYLSNTGVTGDIQALKSLPQLTEFDLINSGVTGDIQALKSLPQLTTFWLNHTGVTGDKDAFHAHRASAGLKECDVKL